MTPRREPLPSPVPLPSQGGGRGAGPQARLDLAARLWGWRPHDGQKTLLLGEAGVKVAACGRRWGKTEALAVDVATGALTRPGLAQMVVAPTYDQARILFDRAEALLWQASENGAAGEFPHLARMEAARSPYPRLVLGAKTEVSARTAGRDGRGLRGQGADRVIVDEAAYVDDRVIREVVMPMLATTRAGGELVLISTPFGRRGLFWEAFCKGQDGSGRYWSCRFPTAQNPLVSAGYLEDQRADLTERAYRAEYEAEFLEDGGTVFWEDDLRAALVADDHPAPVPGARYVAGVDFGRRADYTAVAVVACGPVLRVVELARMQGLSWAGQVERVIELLARWRCVRVAADRTGLGDPMTETLARSLLDRRLGVFVDDVLFTSSTKGVLIDNVVVALSQRRLLFPAFPDLLSEMRAFTATPARGPGGRERLAAARGHDDTVCALALAVHAAGPVVASAPSGPLAAVGGQRKAVFTCSA